MNRIFIIIGILTTFYACSNNPNGQLEDGNEPERMEENVQANIPEKGANAICSFEKNVYDLGSLSQGEIVQYTIKFKNTGSEPLIIKSARASCGCTVPKWTREPVLPGKEGQIEFTFDTSGRMGQQNKSITLITNGEERKVSVSFIAEVEAPKENEI